jgi:hypothetical protein
MVAEELNRMGVRPPKGKQWYIGTIYRISLSETHLGKIISNKSFGEAHKKRKETAKEFKANPKSQWVVVENCHEAVKTTEEHERLLLKFSNGRQPFKKNPENVHALTGLLRCGICGHAMTIYKSKEKGEWITQRCWYTNANGDRCENSGVRIRFIMPIIYQYVVQYKEKLLALSTDEEVKEQRLFLNNKRDSLLSEVEKRRSSITRIQSAFEDGAYNLSQYKERSKKVEKEISELEQEIQTTEVKIKNIDEGDVIEKRSKVARFLEMYDSEEESESKKNAILRSFVGSVVMTKHRKAIDLHINFL